MFWLQVAMGLIASAGLLLVRKNAGRALRARADANPALLQRRLSVGDLTFDRKALFWSYLDESVKLPRDKALKHAKALLEDSPLPLVELLDGTDGAYTRAPSARAHYGGRWLLVFRCAACRSATYPAEALLVTRDYVEDGLSSWHRVRAFCPSEHELSALTRALNR